MPGWRWTLFDPYTLETVQIPLNPSEGGEPSRKKNVSTVQTTARDGRTILFEGPPAPLEFDFKITLLSLTEREFWKVWFSKPYQIELINDLGDSYWVYFDRLDMTRKRVSNRPAKFEMSVHAYELNIV